MKTYISPSLTVFAALLLSVAVAGCDRRADAPRRATSQPAGLSGTLVLFHAGSLSLPLQQVSAAFTRENPGVKVLAEAAGSRDCARKISDLGRQCDVFASADHAVISTMLMPAHAAFNISFARNEMSIAYTGRSRRQAEITAANWPDILLSSGVAFGRADPDRDPCGYRTIMVMQLAERYFKQPGLAARLEAKDGEKFVRMKETDLLALLEAGEIDYLFIYRSVAEQHGLKYVPLPDELNLGSPRQAEFYANARVEVRGKAPGEKIAMVGEPMIYSVTMPNNAPNRPAAEAYVAFLLSDKGREVLERNGQPAVRPAKAQGFDRLPAALRPFCAE